MPKELFPNQHTSAAASTTTTTTASRRPVKLPLRKHHSFHFQSSQTAAGAVKNKKSYKNNGPLVFKPFNETNAFKPITPVPKSPNRITPPRVCGTSLKRHMSNVETVNTGRLREHFSLTKNSSIDEKFLNGTGDTSIIRGKRLVYADLAAPLNTTNCFSTCDNNKSVDENIIKLNETNLLSNGGVGKRTTQYATLKFNEVNI